MKKLLFLMLGCLVLFSLTPQARTAKGQVAPDQRFGMTEVFWLPEEAIDLGVGWDRILFYWREIQPAGPDDWNTLHVREEWIAQANSQGRMIVGLLKNTAPWASEDGTEAGIPQGLYLPSDDPGNLWAQYVRRIAAYYGPRNVHNWIVWNEPEIQAGVYGHEFAGSVEDYYQLLKIAYSVMKEVDPEAQIHLAGLTWWHDQTYLSRLFALMLADPEGPANDFFFDVISLHIYFRSETMSTVIASVQEVERQFGIEKPIWVNETNAPPNQDPLWPVERPSFDVDVDQQAWFIVQALSLGFAAGAERISVYKLVDINLPPGGESFGVVRPDLSQRPAYIAYKLLTSYLGGFSDVSLQKHPDFFLVSFFRPNGITYVAWARNGEVDVTIPSDSREAALIDISGHSERVTASESAYKVHLVGARCGDECIIGGPPVFLVEGDYHRTSDFNSDSTGLNSSKEVGASSEGSSPTPNNVLLTPTFTAQPLVDPQKSVTVSAGEDGIISAQMAGTATPVSSSHVPALVTSTASSAALRTDRLGMENVQSSGIGLWFIGLGLVVAVSLVLVVRRSQNRE